MANVTDNLVTIDHYIDDQLEQPLGPVTICIWTEDGEGDYILIRTSSTTTIESEGSICEDDVDIVDDNTFIDSRRGNEVKVCGNTTHFTDFSVLLVGPGGVDLKSCGSATEQDWLWLWIAHVAAVGTLCCCFLVFFLVLHSSRRARLMFFASEGERILRLRESKRSYVKRMRAGESQVMLTPRESLPA